MRTGKEPYGVRFVDRNNHSTIYTYKTAREAKACVASYDRDPKAFTHWISITYVGRKW